MKRQISLRFRRAGGWLVGKVCLSILAILGWTGCKQEPCLDNTDPTCESYDPCQVQGTVSADFSMWERRNLGWLEPLPIHRSISANHVLVLRADQEAESYSWYIGEEVTPRTGSEISVSFGSAAFGQIRIRLIAAGLPNFECDPNDDGIDTVDKNVFVLGFEDLPIKGRYKGRNLHKLNEEPFEVEVAVLPEWRYLDTDGYDSALVPDFARMTYYLHNFPNGTPNAAKFNLIHGTNRTRDRLFRASPLSIAEGAEGFYMPLDGNGNGWYSYAPEGYGYLSENYDSLIIHYTLMDSTLYWADPAQLVRTDTITFIGIRQ